MCGFSVQGGFTVLPPPPWNFHDFYTWVSLSLGNFISINNKTKGIRFNLLGIVIKFSRSYSYSVFQPQKFYLRAKVAPEDLF